MPAAYTINREAVAKLLYGKTYYPDMVPIYPDLERRAKEVQRVARLLVGKRTGYLAARIELSSRTVPPFIWFTITGNTRYAYWHHQGTRPHVITGKVGGEMSFREGSRLVHTRLVHHPGTRGNPFLRNALPAFMALPDGVALKPITIPE